MAPPPTNDRPLAAYWQPRYWPIWLGLGLLRVLATLPYRMQRAVGRLLGRLALPLLRRRRAVAATNLRLCFPELSEAERRALLARHFESLGLQLVEVGMAWFASDARVRRLVRLEGLEHLERATAGGKGAILLSGHFAPTEFAGRILRAHQLQVAGLYRTNRNPLVDAVLRRSRARATVDLIPKESMRQLVRRLAQGVSVWYAPDQSYRRRYSVLIPFFGEPAMTNAALTHIARISGAPVVPFFARRLPGSAGYLVTLEPALEGFPSGEEADARRVNALLEREIRKAPEQYYWIHRRFKGRPAGYPDPYATPTDGD
jgi:KDO2-lipid IV(A) lauroyltransferase